MIKTYSRCLIAAVTGRAIVCQRARHETGHHRFGACLALLAVALGISPAFAGVADTPLRQFADGKASVLVQVVPGVVKRVRLQTDFICTALDSAPVDIGVEIFNPAGTLLNDISAGVGAVLGVAPGQTVTIGTKATAAFLESTTIPLADFSQGSGRVVASSDRVRCNVLLLDDALNPPVTLATLGETMTLVAGPALPGVPLPQFADGSSATHAAVITGVVKRGRVETDIFCTSLASQNIDIGVQVFGPGGSLRNDVSAGNGAVLNVAPGATVTLGTTGTAAFLETTVISIAGVAQGLGRVVSTSGAVTCAAFVLDSDTAPPTSMGGIIEAGAAGP
ncbi:MAG: hypothetical protein ACE5I7_13575 [Candidatus Binatia bacterium]